MTQPHRLISSTDELRSAIAPIVDGLVDEVAIDTETTEIRDGYFTTYGTDVQMAGFSLSYGAVDLYVPVRHVPYDWRRHPSLIEADLENDGPAWLRRLIEVEGVMPPCDGSGYIRTGWADGANPNVPLDGALELLGQVLGSRARLYFHNALFDAMILERDGLPLPWGRVEDTQALSVFTDPRPLDKFDEAENQYIHGGHALKHLGEVWLGIPADAQALLQQAKQALGKGSGRLEDYSMLPLRTAIAPYAAMDTRLTLRLAHHCQQRPAYASDRVREMLRLHAEERPLLLRVMREGLNVDVALAGERAEERRAERIKITQDLKKLTRGRDVPIDSPVALQVLLFDELRFPSYNGNRNTRDATLKHMRARVVANGLPLESGISNDDAAAILDSIREYRRIDKELNSFYAPLSEAVNGEIHPIINPLGARTTRQTASKPNAHQMKRPDKEHPEQSVRHLFRPPDGHTFVCADYNAQEMRIAAHYALATPSSFKYRFTWRCTLNRRGDCKGKGPHGDDVLHVGFRETISERPEYCALPEGFLAEGTSFDPHKRMVEMVAERGYGLPRVKCKAGNFAILYGCGGYKLADVLDIPVNTAYGLIRMFWDDAYPELGRVKLFIGERLRRVGPETNWSHQDYLLTLHGAPIYLDDAYKGLNYLIQRSCREILLKAELAAQEYIGRERLPYRIALPVHDEIIFEMPKDSVERAHVRNLCRLMVEAGAMSKIPMAVEPKIATESWAMKEDLPGDWGWNGGTDA